MLGYRISCGFKNAQGYRCGARIPARDAPCENGHHQ